MYKKDSIIMASFAIEDAKILETSSNIAESMVMDRRS